MPFPDDASPPDPSPGVVVDPLRRLARRFEFDRAVFYALAARAWQTLAGPITAILIASYYSVFEQDYYYIFGSLLSFQALFELSLGVVLLNAAGHEWGLLKLGPGRRIDGDEAAASRLAGLVRLGTRWYSGAAVACWFIVGSIGLWMFRDLPVSGKAAWVVTISASAAGLALLPRMAILHGCQQVEAVNRNAAMQAVCSSLIVWATVVAGLGLWAVAASWTVKILWDAWLVLAHYREFFGSLKRRTAAAIRWSKEIWPLQWRLAIQGVTSAIATSSFVLSLYARTDGAAGRMGMSLAVLNMLLWGGLAWVQTRIPILADHSRRDDRTAYNHLFTRIATSTIFAVAAGAVAFCLVIAAMNALELQLAERLVDTRTFAILAAAITTQHILNCITLYARTRKREPFVITNVILNLAIAAGVWLAAPLFGEFGVASVYATLLVAVGVPVWITIWQRERRAWPGHSLDD